MPAFALWIGAAAALMAQDRLSNPTFAWDCNLTDQRLCQPSGCAAQHPPARRVSLFMGQHLYLMNDKATDNYAYPAIFAPEPDGSLTVVVEELRFGAPVTLTFDRGALTEVKTNGSQMLVSRGQCHRGIEVPVLQNVPTH